VFVNQFNSILRAIFINKICFLVDKVLSTQMLAGVVYIDGVCAVSGQFVVALALGKATDIEVESVVVRLFFGSGVLD
jgi:hypothetical protein